MKCHDQDSGCVTGSNGRSRPRVLAELPRTPWGAPDLQGIYTSDNWIGVPMQRPARFGSRQYLSDDEYAERVRANVAQIAPDLPARATSLIVYAPDCRLPAVTAAGQELAALHGGAVTSR